MPHAYQPTETDRLTGANLRRMRRERGLTAEQFVDAAGLGFSYSKYGYIEQGKRLLTSPVAAKIAAFYGIGVDQVIIKPAERRFIATQGARSEVLEPAALSHLFPRDFDFPAVADQPPAGTLTIDLNNPMHPEKYRTDVWLPYLEARYAADQIAS